MATHAERRAKTRQKLIDSAKKIFKKQGFESTSVDQIVAAANVAKGTFYQYYDTKIDILADVARDEGADKTKSALEAVAAGAPALAVLERYFQALCEWFEEREKIAAALIYSSLKTIGDESAYDPHRSGRGFITELLKLAQQQGAIRYDVDARQLAKMLGATFAVTVLAWSRNPEPGLLAPSMNECLKVFLEGARKLE